MFETSEIILYYLLIILELLFILSVAEDITVLKNKGIVFCTKKTDINIPMLFLIVLVLNFSLMLLRDGDIVCKIFITVAGMITLGYWTYRAFSRETLCEHILVTPEYIYSSEDFIGYEMSSMMEEEGNTKLWIKLTRGTLFGKGKIKEVCFTLKNEQITEVEELLKTWKK